MKEENKEKSKVRQEQQDPNFRRSTNVPGQNPKANDDPSHDEHNDQARRP